MKKILLTAAILALTAGTSFALGITNSKHNLATGSTAAIKATTQSQICIFCHTPHNAIQNVPLWNRSTAGMTAASAYKLYTSSASLTNATKNAKLYGDSQSLFCMSCHDGTVNELGSRVQNKGGDAMAMGGGAAVWSGAGGTASSGNAMLGSNLTNDHPVGFSYGLAVTQDNGALNAVATVTGLLGNKTVFFKANAGAVADSMECSSCHAVHDNQYSPFLRTTNSGSSLCLACHNK